MTIRLVVTTGFGNGTFSGQIAALVTRGFIQSSVATSGVANDAARMNIRMTGLVARKLLKSRHRPRTRRM